MNIQIKGKITDIKDSETFGNFEKRSFYVEELEGQYPNTFNLEAQQAYCNTLDNFSIGDTVDCSVDVRGRAWEKGSKSGVINTLKCWKIVKVGSAPARASVAVSNGSDINEPMDDLPF